MSERDISTSLGAIRSIPSFVNSTTLGTAPVKVTVPTGYTDYTVFRIKIVNGHNSHAIAWTLVERGADAPSITADFASTSGSIILAGSSEYINVRADMDLYIVASGSSTHVNITIFAE